MISLPNNCTCSEISVTPKNWKTCKASALERNWYIQYYFYDNTLDKRKFIIVKGMNRFKTLQERREATTQLIYNELYQLKEKGFNPITGKFTEDSYSGIDPKTGFIEALRKAFKLVKCEGSTLLDIKSSIHFFEMAAKKMGIEKLEIQLAQVYNLCRPILPDFVRILKLR